MTRANRGRRRVVRILLVALVCVVSMEAAARVFWRVRYGVPLLHPGRILYAFYPELKIVDETIPSRSDPTYDILLLGGSALNRCCGDVQQALREQLAYAGHRNVRVYNLAMPGHTSRDSRLKYAALGVARFELVVFYHGINDARANNAPPEIFKQDYSHYEWYEVVNALAPYHGAATVALPYTVRYLTIVIRQKFTKGRYAPPEIPRKDWVRYGADIRTAASFKENLGVILDLAAERGDRTMLMTFATYVPDDYSLKAFKDHRLDYALHSSPIEMWGAPENVLKAVAAHNEVVRGLAAQKPGVLFADQAALMAGHPRDFNDVCHFTVTGSLQFAEHMLQALLPSLDRN